MSVKILLSTLIVTVLATKATGLCDFPCSVRNREWYFAKFDASFRVVSSSQVQVLFGEDILDVDCFQRSGPFIVTRRFGNEYACSKILYLGSDLFIARVTAYRQLHQPPELCDICSTLDEFNNLEVWVELGCDVPKNCPSGSYDNPCTGCEEGVPDDGYCCEAHDGYP